VNILSIDIKQYYCGFTVVIVLLISSSASTCITAWRVCTKLITWVICPTFINIWKQTLKIFTFLSYFIFMFAGRKSPSTIQKSLTIFFYHHCHAWIPLKCKYIWIFNKGIFKHTASVVYWVCFFYFEMINYCFQTFLLAKQKSRLLSWSEG
jgi:hypothetical protein